VVLELETELDVAGTELEALVKDEETKFEELERLDEETGVADETETAVELEETGTVELEETTDDELGAIIEELEITEEAGIVDEELNTDDTGVTELDDTLDEELTVLDEATGVAEETEIATELADAGTLLTKLEIIELGIVDEELNTDDTGVTELLLKTFERLLETSDIEFDTIELAILTIADTDDEVFELTELLEISGLLESLETKDDTTLETEVEELFEELFNTDELEVSKLDKEFEERVTTLEELTDELTDETGDALKTTFKGLLQGIVKSKLIAKKLYCTRHTKPLPFVKV
jgi:hypothetical protein